MGTGVYSRCETHTALLVRPPTYLPDQRETLNDMAHIDYDGHDVFYATGMRARVGCR